MKYGLLNKKIKPQEYILGANSPLRKSKENTSGDWSLCLPKEELQKYKGLETMSCVSQAYNNCVETLVKFDTGKEFNFSDRYLAKVSNTTKKGNWVQDVCEKARDGGVCEEEFWTYPDEKAAYTWDDYYRKVSNSSLIEAWKYHGSIKHEWVARKDWEEALKYSPLLITVNAWYKNSEGEYYNPSSSQNHAVMLLKIKDGQLYIFDTYAPHIKVLTLDHEVGFWAKSFTIKKEFTMQFKDNVLYSANVNGSRKLGFILDGRLVVNEVEGDKFNVFFTALERGCDVIKKENRVSITAEDFNSIEHINLKGEKAYD